MNYIAKLTPVICKAEFAELRWLRVYLAWATNARCTCATLRHFRPMSTKKEFNYIKKFISVVSEQRGIIDILLIFIKLDTNSLQI